MEPRRALRVDDITVKCILDSLDAQNPQPVDASESARQRYPYRVPALRVELQAADGSIVRYAAPSRHIGPDGMSFLVGNLVYPDSVCKIDLITTHNHWLSVTGTIVRCKYVQGTGSVYEAEVRFRQPIDIALFVAQALRVRVLLVDDSPTARSLMARMLQDFSTEVVPCEGGQEAIEVAFSRPFDLVLMDMEMPGVDGFQATRELRAKGFPQPIVAVTALTSPGDRERCLEAGCDDYLSKPPNRQEISDLINRLRPEPLISSLAGEHPELAPAIGEFVQEAHQRAMRMQKAFAGRDFAVVAQESRALKGEAPGHGFEPIGAAAVELEDALRQSLPVPDLHVRVGKLVRLCCAARPPAGGTS